MKRTPRTALSLFLAALALSAATVGFALLPAAGNEAPARLAQSTSAILEHRAA